MICVVNEQNVWDLFNWRTVVTDILIFNYFQNEKERV